MHPSVYAEFATVCAERGACGSVLELGAVPSPESLLCLPALAAATEKIGISLDGPSRYLDFEIMHGNANSLSDFPDQRFDTVLCNSLLEHDAFFWKTLAEIRRVAKHGALIVIGVPGYGDPPGQRLRQWLGRLRNSPLLPGQRFRASLEALLAVTPTLRPHYFPGDYYRFSRQAVEEVILGGLREIRVRSLMMPPRYVGSAFKPNRDVAVSTPIGSSPARR